MKQANKNLTSVMAILFCVLFLFASNVFAQETADPENLPFIDRDGDGINDILQNEWGERFQERHEKRQLVMEQLNVMVIRGEEGPLVDLDGDGTGDQSLRDFMKENMETMIDTDGDGTPDTAVKDYLGPRHKGIDEDGDGKPDRPHPRSGKRNPDQNP